MLLSIFIALPNKKSAAENRNLHNRSPEMSPAFAMRFGVASCAAPTAQNKWYIFRPHSEH
jgi:hypothetical protein